MVLAIPQVWSESFRSRLSIREKSRHAACSVCIKHRLILKQLTGDRVAHQRQTEMYGQHIAAQYRDRCTYWEARSLSRINLMQSGSRFICVILDGMDKSKFRLPRSLCMGAKEFQTFARPALDVHALLCHGHATGVFLSDPMVPKDSSWCMDLLFGMTHKIGEFHDLRFISLAIQCDNTSKEVKNNTTLRGLAYVIANRRLFSAEVRSLRSGHSHEDVDGFFAQLNAVLEARNELHTPQEFRDAIDGYLQLPTTRPDDSSIKCTQVLNSVRDWLLDFGLASD